MSMIPRSTAVRTAIPAIGYREPVIQRRDPMMGIWTEAWYTFSTVGRPAWYTWAYGAWNGDVPFTEDASQLSDPDAATDRFAAVEADEALTPINLVPVVPQFAETLSTDRLVPEVTVDAWATMGAGAYVTAGVWRPGRMGNLRITEDGRVIPYGSTTVQSSNAPGLRRSSGSNRGPSATLILSGGANTGATEGELEFIDFNGDRLPDSVSLSGVQYQGNHQFAAAVPMTFSFGALRRTSTTGGRVSVGLGSAAAPLANQNSSGGSNDDNRSFMPSFGTTSTTATTSIDLIDINADGLPDSVRAVGSGEQYWLEVQLNLGYRLGAPSRIPVPTAGLQSTPVNPLALATEFSIGNSFQFGYAGIGGGPRTTTTRGETRFIDINGDQLPDKVTKVNGESFFRVQLNRGEEFGQEVFWTAPAWPAGLNVDAPDTLRATSSTSFNAGVGVPIMASFAVVCLIAEVSGQFNTSTRDTDIEMMDIDGDGHVDQVRREGNTLLARRNPTAGSNLLRNVYQPLGGSFELTYRREGNRVGVATDGSTTPVDMPRQQWVLAEVSRHAHPGGPVANRSRYEYFSSGFYDRVERESYGYAHVRTIREDDSTVDVRYHNQDYYRHGLPYEVTEANAAGALFSRTRTTYETPTGALPLTGTFFPAATLEELSWYEGTTTDPAMPLKTTQRHRVYDSYGSLTQMRDDGDVGTDDNVIYTITPHSDLTHWIFGVESIVATNATNTVLRRRDSHQRTDGAMDSMTEYVYGGREPTTGTHYNGGPTHRAVTTLDYDAFGNVQQATDPSGFTVIYTYEPVTRSYRESTLDGLGYTQGGCIKIT